MNFIYLFICFCFWLNFTIRNIYLKKVVFLLKTSQTWSIFLQHVCQQISKFVYAFLQTLIFTNKQSTTWVHVEHLFFLNCQIGEIFMCQQNEIIYHRWNYGLWWLTLFLTIFQLYRGDQFYWWRKPEYPEKTINET